MMPSTTTNKKTKRILTSLAVAVFWIAIWWIAAALIDQQLVLPTPLEVGKALVQVGGTEEFRKGVAASFGRIIAGFGIGVVLGVGLGVLSALFEVVSRLLSPAVNVLNAAPVASFTILAMMWFKSENLPTALSAVMVLPMLYSATVYAIKNIDPKLVEMGRVFGLKESEIFFSVKVRSLLPHVVASAVSALGFAWKAGIAAEVICRPQWALGSQLYDAKLYLEMPTVFAVTAVTVVLSILLEILLKKVTASFSYSKGGDSRER